MSLINKILFVLCIFFGIIGILFLYYAYIDPIVLAGTILCFFSVIVDIKNGYTRMKEREIQIHEETE